MSEDVYKKQEDISESTKKLTKLLDDIKKDDPELYAELCDCFPKHCEHGDSCWCEPVIEIHGNNKIIIHNEGH